MSNTEQTNKRINEPTSLTGIILAGGKSARFKSPKYLAKIGDKSLLEIAIAKLEPFCSEIIVVSKEKGLVSGLLRSGLRGQSGVCRVSSQHPKRTDPDLTPVLEKQKYFHPLIGIKEGLRASHNDANVVLACDMPFVSRKLIIDLFPSVSPFSKNAPFTKGGYGGFRGLRGIFEIRLYRYQGRVEPLIGFYRKSCLGKIASFKSTSIVNALSKCNINYIDIKDKWLDFFNINTKEDLVEAQKIAQRNPQLLGN